MDYASAGHICDTYELHERALHAALALIAGSELNDSRARKDMTPKMDIPARRLWNHWISQTRSDSPEQVVYWPGALQAQDNESVKWAVGLRSAGLTTAGFDTAVAGELPPAWLFWPPLAFSAILLSVISIIVSSYFFERPDD